MSVNEKMTAIADNIRSKTGGTEALTLDGMASGVNEVYEAGKQAEYDAFWDAFQNYGKRNNYCYAFCNTDLYDSSKVYGAWDEKTFLPKYPIKPKSTNNIVFHGIEIDNFKEHCEKNGIVIDFSEASSLSNAYNGLRTKYVPDINAKNAKNMNSLFYTCTRLLEIPDILNAENVTSCKSTYYGCYSITRIPRLWATNVTDFSSAFYNNVHLTEITTIEGEISVSISFSYSPLTVESMKSIITHLKNYAGTDKEFTYKVTFSSACKTALEAEGVTAEYTDSEGVTIMVTWVDYVSLIGWVLA